MPTMIINDVSMEDPSDAIPPVSHPSSPHESQTANLSPDKSKHPSESPSISSSKYNSECLQKCPPETNSPSTITEFMPMVAEAVQENPPTTILRTVGANEEFYMINFDSFVLSILCDNNQKLNADEQLMNYSYLPPEKQELLLKDVDDLLVRIKDEAPIDFNKFVVVGVSTEIEFKAELNIDESTDEESPYIDDSSFTTCNNATCNNTSLTSNNRSMNLLDSIDDDKNDATCENDTTTNTTNASISLLNDVTNRTINSNHGQGCYKVRFPYIMKKQFNLKEKSKKSSNRGIEMHFGELALSNPENDGDSEILTDPEDASIEYFRGNETMTKNLGSQISSPLLRYNNLNKRIATTSGKRGTDTRRTKLDQKSSKLDSSLNEFPQQDKNGMDVSHFHDESQKLLLSPSQMRESESPMQSQIPFLGTQSPIENHQDGTKVDVISPPFFSTQTHKDSSTQPIRRTLQFDNYVNSESRRDEVGHNGFQNKKGKDRFFSVSSLRSKGKPLSQDTIEPYLSEQYHQNTTKRGAFEVSHHLREGVAFRLEPLQVRRQMSIVNRNLKTLNRKANCYQDAENIALRPKQLSFSNPFSIFSEVTVSRLTKVVSWIQKQETKGFDGDQSVSSNSHDSSRIVLDEVDTSKKGVVLSLSQSQIRAVTLTFLQSSASRRKNCISNDGGILLVIRDKDELKEWELYFREQSSFSVLNHASLAAAERKRGPTSRFSGFDVVLTTFDALKAKEQTQAVNEDEHAIVMSYDGGSSRRDEWYSCRNVGDAQACKQLSMLHRIIWQKVLFVDVLGRGCYLSKDSTARMLSCKALNAISR